MDVRSDFLRQRRNLMIISLLLLFAEATGIKMEEINLFGNKVLLDNPEMVNWALWIGLAYWFLRYYQYFRKIQDKDFMNTFNAKMANLVLKDPRKYLPKVVQLVDKLEMNTENCVVDEVEVTDTDMRKYTLRFFLSYPDGAHYDVAKGVVYSPTVVIDFKHLIAPIIRSFFYVQLHTTFFTEYILPFLLFLAPITYKIYSWLPKA